MRTHSHSPTAGLAITACLAASAFAATAAAETITQSIDFDWDGDGPPPAFVFAPFDDAGGTRELTGVTAGFVGDLGLDFEFANYAATPVTGGTWSGEVSYTFLLNFGENAPLVGIGGIFGDGFTGDLSAGTGSPFDPPGDVTVPVSLAGDIDFEISLSESTFDFFSSDVPELNASAGSFTDIVVTPPPGGGFISGINFVESQSGTVALTYEFTTIPAPAALAMFGLAGVVRRRRRN
ncbi:MAG: hypothetical protein AB8G96_07250 [Phycisphaerales bacterium]